VVNDDPVLEAEAGAGKRRRKRQHGRGLLDIVGSLLGGRRRMRGRGDDGQEKHAYGALLSNPSAWWSKVIQNAKPMQGGKRQRGGELPGENIGLGLVAPPAMRYWGDPALLRRMTAKQGGKRQRGGWSYTDLINNPAQDVKTYRELKGYGR